MHCPRASGRRLHFIAIVLKSGFTTSFMQPWISSEIHLFQLLYTLRKFFHSTVKVIYCNIYGSLPQKWNEKHEKLKNLLLTEQTIKRVILGMRHLHSNLWLTPCDVTSVATTQPHTLRRKRYLGVYHHSHTTFV